MWKKVSVNTVFSTIKNVHVIKALNALIGIGCFYVGEINILYANL